MLILSLASTLFNIFFQLVLHHLVSSVPQMRMACSLPKICMLTGFSVLIVLTPDTCRAHLPTSFRSSIKCHLLSKDLTWSAYVKLQSHSHKLPIRTISVPLCTVFYLYCYHLTCNIVYLLILVIAGFIY